VLFMDGGNIVEDDTPAEVFDNPKHPRLQRVPVEGAVEIGRALI
jgi:ABC-type polar amino acid transport system ATPase subunit